jgi:hypothetical protein
MKTPCRSRHTPTAPLGGLPAPAGWGGVPLAEGSRQSESDPLRLATLGTSP